MLKGKRVLLTEEEDQQQELVRKLKSRGAQAVHLPMIQLKEFEEGNNLKTVFNEFEKYEWLVLTSPNVVTFFFKAAEEVNLKFYFFPNFKIATVGEKTKLTLEQIGYRTNFVPIKDEAFVLARDMDIDIKGKNVLIPKSTKDGNEYLEAFTERGAIVNAIPVYDELEVNYTTDEFIEQMKSGIDYITFTNEIALRSFVANRDKSGYQLKGEQLIYLNSSLAEIARELGLAVHEIAQPQTIDGMVDQMNKR